MTLSRRVLPLAVIAFALAAAPAGASGPVPLLASQRAQDVAVAGGDVVVVRAGTGGSVRVDALPNQGGPARPLLSLPARGRGWEAFPTVSASPQRVALSVLYLRGSGEVGFRLYSGPETGPLALVQHGGLLSPSAPLDAQVDGDRMLVFEAGRTKARLRLIAPGVPSRVVPWPGEIGGQIAFAGDHVAFFGTAKHRTDPNLNHLFIVDVATGARLASTRLNASSGFDLARDGRVVADGDSSIFTLAPGVPRRRLPGTDQMREPQFAGAAVAGVQDSVRGTTQPVVLDPGSLTPRAIGVGTGFLAVMDADEHGVAWIANNCVLYAPLDATAPDEPPAGPCPRVETDVEGASSTLHGRRLRLRAFCIAGPASGCSGTAEVRLQRHGIMGRGRFHAELDKHVHFGVRLNRSGVRAVRRLVRRDGSALLRIITRTVDGGPPDRDGLMFVDRVR
jgi:hypothetical protein